MVRAKGLRVLSGGLRFGQGRVNHKKERVYGFRRRPARRKKGGAAIKRKWGGCTSAIRSHSHDLLKRRRKRGAKRTPGTGCAPCMTNPGDRKDELPGKNGRHANGGGNGASAGDERGAGGCRLQPGARGEFGSINWGVVTKVPQGKKTVA